MTAIRNQWILVTCIVGVGAAASLGAMTFTHPKYTATTSVLMVPDSSQASSILGMSSGTQPLRPADLPSIATDPTVLVRFAADIGETSPIDKLRLHIRAKVSSDSTIMPVEYTAQSRDKAIAGANTLCDEIVRFYRDVATNRFDALIVDLNGQLSERRNELTKLDSKLAMAAQSYPYVDVSVPGAPAIPAGSVFGRLVEIRTERDALGAEMKADAAAARDTSRLIGDASPLAERDVVNNDTAYRNLRDQHAKDLATLKHISAFAGVRYPGLTELRTMVAHEAAMVAAERRNAASAGPASNPVYVAALDSQVKADALYAGDRAKWEAFNAQLEQLNSQMGARNLATDVARIRRDRSTIETAYATIAERLAKAIADRTEAASTGSVIILDRARSAQQAVFASGGVIAVGILFLTGWLAVTLAVMIDGPRERFNDAHIVQVVYGTTLIGSVL
jgi:uncharacterized protein involved in exopolysaccharide biosynthesis